MRIPAFAAASFLAYIPTVRPRRKPQYWLGWADVALKWFLGCEGSSTVTPPLQLQACLGIS